MRNFIVAGNWKMNMDIQAGLGLIDAVRAKFPTEPTHTKVVLCPSYPLLYQAHLTLKASFLRLGAQNMHFENDGAFTGEVSGTMLRAAGCEYVVLGHSERRQYFGETDEIISKKIRKALECGLLPIVCVGETLEQRKSGHTEEVVGGQVRGALSGISSMEMNGMILAYEPVWAIGTGLTATPVQAQDVHAFIRLLLTEMYSPEVAAQVMIQYGGSMKPENAFELLSQPDIDGGLIGGASLKADQFFAIVDAAEMVGSA